MVYKNVDHEKCRRFVKEIRWYTYTGPFRAAAFHPRNALKYGLFCRLMLHEGFDPVRERGISAKSKQTSLYISRVDEAKNSELDATSKWQQERRQVVHMEKQLSRVQSGQQGVAKGRGKGYGTGSAVQERQAKTEDLEELATR